MKMFRALVVFLALLPAIAWGQAKDAPAPAPAGYNGRLYTEVLPQYYTPEAFGAYGDTVRAASEPFIAVAASNVFQIAATYRFYGIGAITNGTKVLTVNFNPSYVPPFNLTTKPAGVSWGVNINGVFYNLSSTSCAGSTCTINIATNYAASTTTTADVTVYQNATNPTVGNPNVETYQSITTADATFPVSDGVPQAVLLAAQAAGDINSVNQLNVSTVTLTNGFFAVAVSTASSDIGSTIQIATPSGLYEGTIIAEASNSVAYVYPRLPAEITALTTYAIWGPYLFHASDATSPAKYIQMPMAGATPSANWVGTVPLVSQIASVVDTFNATLVTNPSASVTAVGGHLIIGHDDTQALTRAAQLCGRGRYQGLHYVYLKKNYFAATYPGSANGGTALNSCILVGEGRLDYGQSVGASAIQYYFHGPAPLTFGRLNTAPTSDIIPSQHFHNCNTNPTSCTITFVGDSNFTQFTNGPSQSDNWEVKYCMLATLQFAPKVVHCNYMGVGGSVWSDLDPAGPTSGIPASFAQYSWYTAGVAWINQVRDGTSGASTAAPQTMTGCPDVIMGKWTNNEGAAFSYGSMVNVINYTQSTAWHTTCGTNPDWEVATEGEQTLGDPNINAGVQPDNDYAALAIRGFAYACPVKLASGYCVGLIGDVQRLNHILVDGFDPETIPMRRDDDGPPYSFPTYHFPVTWPGYVSEGLSWNTFISYAPSLGTCTWVSATTFANNLANAQCAWGQWSNELDFLIGNPNGSQTGSSPGSGATIDYPGNQVRLLFCQNGTGCAAGSVAGMVDYEIDTWRFGITATGTSGTNTLACASACVSITKHLASTVINANIPADCHISAINTAGTSITLSNADGTACNLTGNITSSANNVTVAMIQVPRTSSGQYGFACQTITGGANQFNFLTIWEFRGTSLHISPCGSATPNWVDTKVVRFGNQFQPTLSTPAGNVSGLSLRWASAGVCCGSSSMVARPEYPTYAASFAGKDIYGWCQPTSPSVAAISGPYLGQCATHKSTIGSKIEDMTMTTLRMAQ
jgi:hypothetical protein